MKTWNRGRNSGCHGFGVFDKAVSLWFGTGFEEHSLTEDRKTVAPFFTDFFIKSTSSPVIQTVQLDVVSSDRNCPAFPFELGQLGQLDHCNQLHNHAKSLQKREVGQLCQLGQLFLRIPADGQSANARESKSVLTPVSDVGHTQCQSSKESA